MPDDLTALLRRALDAEGRDFSWDFYYEADRQGLAVRLAEALIEKYGPIHLPLTERLEVKVLLEQRDIARESEAEAVKHCRTLLSIIDVHRKPGGYMTEHAEIEQARAYLARREEANRDR